MRKKIKFIDVFVSFVIFALPFFVVAYSEGSIGVFLLFSNVFVATPLYWLIVFHFGIRGPLRNIPWIGECLGSILFVFAWVWFLGSKGVLMPKSNGEWATVSFLFFAANCWFVGFLLARSAALLRVSVFGKVEKKG
jgi:hypothetical protein